ncbi:MAG: S9 family peptidase [Rhizonema sp. PD37]|nr:S9 family peptidase [Rhizonema sp. PD37]
MTGKQYFSIEEAIALPRFSSLCISDDGKKVAWVQRQTDWDSNSYQYHVWIYENGRSYPLTRGIYESFSPQWSSDSQSLAYLGKVSSKKKQIFIKADGEAAGIQVSHAPEDVSELKWSPSERRLFFLAQEPESKAVIKRRELYGNIEYVNRDCRSSCLFYLDIDKGLEKTNSNFTLPKDLRESDSTEDNNKTPQKDEVAVQLTVNKNLHIYEFDISPSGDKIVFLAAPSPILEDRDKLGLYILDIGSRNQRQLEIPFVGFKSNIGFSPDGKFVHFNYYRSGRWFDNQLLAVINIESSEISCIPINNDEDIESLSWSKKGILIRLPHHTSIYVSLVNLPGKITNLFTENIALKNNDFIQNASITKDSEHLAYLKANPHSLYEIYLNNQPITKTSIVLENHLFARKQVISWKNSDGIDIEGILSTPENFNSNQQYPLLVIVHGGPRATSLPLPLNDIVYPIESFIAKGFIVLEPNYRGSAGYGEAFRSLNYRNLGIGDQEDVISGVDYLINQGFVDSEKVGLMGWSQGGYISAYCSTYSDRFKAISVGAGISNWVTYYVGTDIPTFTRYYLGDNPWNDPIIYQITSPMSGIKSACTPTLIQHGDNDKRVPVSNAYELYRGLQDMGVETELVIFKNMEHGSSNPGTSRALMKQNLIWFCHYILGESKDEFYLLSKS